MSQTWGLTEEIIRRARERGIEITPEEAAAIAAEESLGSSPESRTDGAPDVQVTGETPPAYYDDIDTRMRQLQDGGASNPSPNDPGFATEGDLLQYRVGMTPEEYDAAKANQRYRTSQLRRPDLHPQQQLDLGTADDMEMWGQYLEGNPDAQRRYDPAAYEQRMASQRAEEDAAHARMLAAKYGQPAADAYMESRRTGAPMGMQMVRTSEEDKRVKDRNIAEMMARQEGVDGPARDELRLQDNRTGYAGAMGGYWGSQMPAVGKSPEGEVELKSERFARKTQERKAAEAARRTTVATNAMLAGPDPGRNMTNAFRMLGNPEGFGLTPNQQRALQYMLPGGQYAAEVDANNMRTATEMATAGLRSTLVPLVTAGIGGAGGPDAGRGRTDVEGGANGTWNSPEGRTYLLQMAEGFNNPEDMEAYLVQHHDYSADEARFAVGYVKSKWWNW